MERELQFSLMNTDNAITFLIWLAYPREPDKETKGSPQSCSLYHCRKKANVNWGTKESQAKHFNARSSKAFLSVSLQVLIAALSLLVFKNTA